MPFHRKLKANVWYWTLMSHVLSRSYNASFLDTPSVLPAMPWSLCGFLWGMENNYFLNWHKMFSLWLGQLGESTNVASEWRALTQVFVNRPLPTPRETTRLAAIDWLTARMADFQLIHHFWVFLMTIAIAQTNVVIYSWYGITRVLWPWFPHSTPPPPPPNGHSALFFARPLWCLSRVSSMSSQSDEGRCL